MNKVLDILSASDVKGIMALHNNGVSCKNYYGSSAWYNNWITVANTFNSDNRIAAFSIFGEPEHYSGYDTWAPGITSSKQVQEKALELARAIHQIDPDRVVIMPYGMTYGRGNIGHYIADIQAIGALNEPNLVFDILHPYFIETLADDMGLSPSQKAQWYGDNVVKPCVAAFGADRCYIGETFAWGGKTQSYQIQFLTEMINVFVEYHVGFTVWAYFSSPNQSWQNEAIAASSH